MTTATLPPVPLPPVPDRFVPETVTYPPQQGDWTYDDYARFTPEYGDGTVASGFRYEVLEGRLVTSPTPFPKHQSIVGNLGGHLNSYLRPRRLGRVVAAPIDVLLAEKVVVQPDLVVILKDRLHIIETKNIVGPPDLLIEILSPSTAGRDVRDKFDLYARYGGREYWLVDPVAETVEVYVLRDDVYALLGRFQQGEHVASEVLPELRVAVSDVFEGP